MIQLKDIGKFATLPDVAMHIHAGDIHALRQAIGNGWKMEEGIALSKYTTLTPLEIALVAERMEVVKLLVEHGISLNAKHNPALLTAIRYCGEEIIRYLVAQGASLKMHDKTASDIYQQAYYGNKDNIGLIARLGLDIKKHGGRTLRTAVSDHDLRTTDYLLDQGANIDFSEPDMVYPYGATPLTVATRKGDMAMVRYLVERGADVTLTEKDGERAYTIAVASGNMALAAYLKVLEPPALHSLENKQQQLKNYRLPKILVDFLMSDHPSIKLAENDCAITHIDFFTLADTIEMKIGRKKMLRLSAVVDNYSSVDLVWNPRQKCIGAYDAEHGEYHDLCSAEEFFSQPDAYILKFIMGEFGE